MSFEEGLGEVTSVCFTGDGEHVLTAGSEGLIRWSIPDGRAWVIDEVPCTFVAAERGSERAAVLDDNERLRLYDLEREEPLVAERGLDFEPLLDASAEGWTPLAFTEEGAACLVADEAGLRRVPFDQHEEPELVEERRGVREVIASGAAFATHEDAGVFLASDAGVRQVAKKADAITLHPGGRWLAWAAGKKIVIETPAGALVEEIERPSGNVVERLRFDDDDALLIVDRKYRAFRWREGKGTEALAMKAERHDGFGTAHLSPRGDRVALWDNYYGRVDVHDVDAPAPLVSLGRFTLGEDSGSQRVWTSPDGKVAVFHAGIGDGQNSNDDLFLFDLEAQRVITRFVEAELFTPFVIGDELIAAIGGSDEIELIAWSHAGEEIARVPLEDLEEDPVDDGLGAAGHQVWIPDPDEGGYIVDVKTKAARRVDEPPAWARQGTRLY